MITVCLVITNYDINGQNNENVEKRVVRLSFLMKGMDSEEKAKLMSEECANFGQVLIADATRKEKTEKPPQSRILSP